MLEKEHGECSDCSHPILKKYSYRWAAHQDWLRWWDVVTLNSKSQAYLDLFRVGTLITIELPDGSKTQYRRNY